MIAVFSWMVLVAAAPIELDLDVCVGELVSTATVASLIELELSPREVLWVDGADRRVECADVPEAVKILAGPSVMVLALNGLRSNDRARAIALAFAEELRLREQLEYPRSMGTEPAPGGPRLEATVTEAVRPSPPPSMFVAASVLKPVNDAAVVVALSGAVARTGGTVRPRFGGSVFAGQGDQKRLAAFSVDLGASLIFVEIDGVDLGFDVSSSFGIFAQDKVGVFGLAMAGVLLQVDLGKGIALETRLSAGSFLPAAVTTSLSVGVAFVP